MMSPGSVFQVCVPIGPPDNVLIVEVGGVWGGGGLPLISDHCGRCIDLTPRFPLFFHARAFHTPLPPWLCPTVLFSGDPL